MLWCNYSPEYIKKVLKLAKGYYGNRSKIYRVANEAVLCAQYVRLLPQKISKRDYRKLWIVVYYAACRLKCMCRTANLSNALKNANV